MKLPNISLRYKVKSPNKRGELPLILLITYEKKIFTKGLGMSILPDLIQGTEIAGTDKLTLMRNIEIRNTINDLQKKFIYHADQGTLSPDSIRSVLLGDKQTGLDYWQLFERVERIYKGVLGNSRFKSLKSSAKKFTAWSKSMPVDKINASILLAYEGYLRKEKRHAETSIWSDMADLKSLAGKAKLHKIINCEPFNGYKIPPYKSPHREYLTVEEVLKIEAYADNDEKNNMLRLVAAWFVLGCYSGMRYSDLRQWNEDKMVRNDCIYFSDVKTSTSHFVPLNPALRRAIERVRPLRGIPENQVCNRSLKEIAASDSCNIQKNITMHLARHTFAVAYLNAGGSKDVLKELLGHKKLETTAIYGKITDPRIKEEAKRVWG